MKLIFTTLGILLFTTGFSQKLDIGFDFKMNQNSFKNQFDLGAENTPDITTTSLTFPDADFSFYGYDYIDDRQIEIFVTYDRTTVEKNFEIPLYVRYSTKKNWFFDVKYSSAKFRVNYEGKTHHTEDYLYYWYGDYEDYQAVYGGQMDSQQVDFSENDYYTDETAYKKYVENYLRYEQGATVTYREEFKLRSIYVGAGYKFAPQKALRPFIYGAIGYRARVTDYGFKHFDFTSNTANAYFHQYDRSVLSDNIPGYNKQLLSARFDIGVEKYRYHLGLSAEFIFNQSSSNTNNYINNYRQPTTSLKVLSFYLGADLFNYSFNTVNKKNDIYNEEFEEFSSRLYNNRLFSWGILVKAPIANELGNYGKYTVSSLRDIIAFNSYDSTAYISEYTYQLLSFGEVLKAEWTPRFESSFRFNVVKRVDVELTAGVSRLQLDTKVTELKTIFRQGYYQDPIDSLYYSYYYYDSNTSMNSGVYRANFLTASLGVNLYATLVSNGYVDFRIFGGVATNFMSYSLGRIEPGINGTGDDIYQEMDDVYDNPGDYIGQFNGIWYSYNDGGINLSEGDPLGMMNSFDNYQDPNTGEYAAGPVSDWDRLENITNNYYTTHFGLEAEINKFIFGVCGDLTVSKTVDGFFIKKYYNVNFTLGYLLFTKNKLGQKKDKANK